LQQRVPKLQGAAHQALAQRIPVVLGGHLPWKSNIRQQLNPWIGHAMADSPASPKDIAS
jgi:hypothetical protein